MRRPSTVELMLLVTVLLWALNLSVTKYILTNGLLPLPYATIRYGLAGAIFVGLTLYVERSLRVARRHVPILVLAAAMLFVNQLSFVFALDITTASTIGLVLGAIPIFAALFGLALGTERPTTRFWFAAALSALGVGLVAAGAGGELGSDLWGILLGLSTAATWAAYSVTVAPLMRSYSPSRMSAVVLPVAWVGLVLVGLPQTADQDWDLDWTIWALLVFATLGPLVLTNILWFRSIHRIGANKATLAANLQPFVAAVLAVILLSEPLFVAPDRRRRAHRRRDPRRAPPAGPPRARPRIRYMSEHDFMPIDGWDHLELWVGNAKQAAYFYESAYGFTRTAYAGPETGVRDRASYVLEQGDIRFVLTSGLRADSDICRWAATKGDSVRDVALAVPDATNAYRQAVQRGARGVEEPHVVEDEHGSVELAAIATYGDNIHTFVNRSEYSGPYLPGYEAVSPNGPPGAGVGLITIDHVVGNVELGRMDDWVDFYARVLGFTQLTHFSDEDISTEYSALMSKVMTDGEGKIKFPINEPAEGKRKSQIEEYLDFHGGPGVQHVAMQSNDIVKTVAALREHGVLFI